LIMSQHLEHRLVAFWKAHSIDCISFVAICV
jgi:hypothetical protein